MKHVQIVIPDLFLPQSLAKDVCAGLQLPALEKILARSRQQSLPTHSLEEWLCDAYAVPDLAIAPVTLRADGMLPGDAYWLRADPVHLSLNRDQVILQTNVAPSMDEAVQLCAYLNQHFADSGMQFFAPHPQRWYLRLENDPQLQTHPVSGVDGRNSRLFMPQGGQALKWNSLLNEIQMALYAHPLHQASEARGMLPINSVWLWGGGRSVKLEQPFDRVYGDSELAHAFVQAGNEKAENALHVWEGLNIALRRGDFFAWREMLLHIERETLLPLLNTLKRGEIQRITLDALQEEGSRRFELARPMLWKVWRRPQPLVRYAPT